MANEEKKVIDILKNNGYTKAQFADDFQVSRPTLDAYINKFENNVAIPNEKYNLIFENLFRTELSRADFIESYERHSKLIKRDKATLLDNLDIDSTNDIFSIVYCLEDSVKDGKSELIPFVKYVVNEYKTDLLATAYVKYFNDLNNLCEVKTTAKEMNYFGNLYHINKLFRNNPSSLRDIYNDEYFKKKKEIRDKNNKYKEEVNKEFNKMLSKFLDETIAEMGEKVDKEALMKQVVEKFKNQIK